MTRKLSVTESQKSAQARSLGRGLARRLPGRLDDIERGVPGEGEEVECGERHRQKSFAVAEIVFDMVALGWTVPSPSDTSKPSARARRSKRVAIGGSEGVPLRDGKGAALLNWIAFEIFDRHITLKVSFSIFQRERPAAAMSANGGFADRQAGHPGGGIFDGTAKS
jgi:hypothetical protein